MYLIYISLVEKANPPEGTKNSEETQNRRRAFSYHLTTHHPFDTMWLLQLKQGERNEQNICTSSYPTHRYRTRA